MKPIHLLANSVFGQSIFLKSPKVEYSPDSVQGSRLSGSYSDTWVCWTAFRSGVFPPADYAFPSPHEYMPQSDIYSYFYGASKLLITYNQDNCTKYRNTTNLETLDLSEEMQVTGSQYKYDPPYGIGDCFGTRGMCSQKRDIMHSPYFQFLMHRNPTNTDIGNADQIFWTDLACLPVEFEPKCRVSVRMSAALTLAICLVIKATYMIVINVSARNSVKTQCLTFGDVIVASSLDRDTRIYNECMVNAGDGYRHKVAHTCHKHCKDDEPSATGDSIGHCQKCTKHNILDKAADLGK